MRPFKNLPAALAAALLAAAASAPASGQAAAQRPAPAAQSAPAQQPAFDQWSADFKGDQLDETKWERFSFQGAGGGKLEVKGGQLRLRSGNETRAGVRSRQSFTADTFRVDARLAKVGPQLPIPGQKNLGLGFGALTILFDGSGRNRLEWVLTSEGTFEAWSVVDGRGERLDDRKQGTKLKNPVLGLIRRGDEFRFVINAPDSPPEQAQIVFKKTIKNLPATFHVMLYGFGSSENVWEAVSVVTLK
jgi:hypothetical protein